MDVRLPEKGHSNSHGARPVHQIISMIKWIRTSELSTKNSSDVAFCTDGFGGRGVGSLFLKLLMKKKEGCWEKIIFFFISTRKRRVE